MNRKKGNQYKRAIRGEKTIRRERAMNLEKTIVGERKPESIYAFGLFNLNFLRYDIIKN